MAWSQGSALGPVFKAQAIRRALEQTLKLQISGAVTFTEYDDATDTYPLLLIARSGVIAGVTTDIWVRIDQVPNPGRVNGIGQAQTVYSPHEVTILQAASDVAANSDLELRYRVLANCAQLGAKLFVYELAYGGGGTAAQPTVSTCTPSGAGGPSITGGSGAILNGLTPVLTLKADAFNPITQSQ
jgi:hypothetical protein